MKPRSTPTARGIAADVLIRVDEDGAFASAALEAALVRAVQLDTRDRGLATELVYGVLRVRPWLEARIGQHARRGVESIETTVRVHLSVAAYQLFFLSRIPAFAAVSEGVDLVTRDRGKAVGAFANAVLRKLSAEAQREKPDRAEAFVSCAPAWLREGLDRALGKGGAQRFLVEAAEPPPVCLRVSASGERDAWFQRLREAVPDASFVLGVVSPFAIVARGVGRAQILPGWSDGAWTVQEEGSQGVALALAAQPGERVLDACAGRGNKTAILARAVGPTGYVDAADLHANKLDRLQKEMKRSGLAPRRVFGVDWSVGSGSIDEQYDAILVDAPCSGVGTLRRRPDLQARRSFEGLESLVALQKAIVINAASRLKPGGRLVYAVCSVLQEEAEGVVAAVLGSMAGLVAAPFADGPMSTHAAGAPAFRLIPYIHGTDGYFLASFHKLGTESGSTHLDS